MTLDRSVAADDDRINRLVLAAHPDVQAVYRYGTWGTAAERPDSDVDIAVLLAARPRDAGGPLAVAPPRRR